MQQRGGARSSAEDRTSGRYDVRETLGSGGMGSVHRCYDRLSRRMLAYKRLRITHESSRSRLVALFQREYDTLARLAHPNVVEVYDYGFDDEGPYFTMELLPGSDLASLAPLSFQNGCRLIRDVASALGLLHARRLIHRDLSPHNVRLTDDGKAKLFDFGALTSFGTPPEIVGTPVFVAPECLSRASLDQRVDLYGLGALAYWAFTRHTHLRAHSFDDLSEAWQQPVVAPSRLVPELPEGLDELLLALLSIDRVARPASAADVIERLTSLADLPPEAEESRVAYSYLKQPPLSGREQPSAHVQHALGKALGGAGQVVWLDAERGLGRSALLAQVAVEAQLAGATVLRADGGTHGAAFSTARHLVHTGLSMSPSVALALSGRNSIIRGVIDGGGGASSSRAPRSAIEASELQSATSALLVEALLQLSLRNPLVLLIDDAHLADDESLSLLASMSEAIQRHPVLLILSARTRAASEHGAASARLRAGASHCRLTSLDESELTELFTSVFGKAPNCRRLSLWLHAQTGGNPGHALDIARLLLARGAIRYTGGNFVLPHEFDVDLAESDHAEAQLARLEGLATSAVEVARLLALHDGPLHPAQIAAALSREVPEVLDGLTQLAVRGAVVSTRDSFSCASEALRQAVVRTLSSEQQRSAHVGLARALAGADPPHLEDRLAIARHLLGAGGAEELEGAYMLAEAGDSHRFEIAMLGKALPLFERALGVLQRHGLSDQECGGLLVPLSLAGFYGSLELQRRYLDRTLEALGAVSGIGLSARLRRYVGARLALLLGMAIAFWAHLFTRRRLNRRSYKEDLLAFTSIMGPATAAAASSYDVDESFRIAQLFEPFSGAPKRSGLYCMREFCLATAELIDGRMKSAYRRYEYVLKVFERPVLGMDDVLREQASLGCLHGMAQAIVTDGSREALSIADELTRRGAFYAPHAECVRMTYYATRGETTQAAVHRERSEAHALQGGTSWSALCTLTARAMQSFILTGDVVALVSVVSDLQRLAKLSPGMAAMAALGQAHLELMRGHADPAIAIYERVLESHAGRMLPTYAVDRSLHVRALLARGDHERARALCLALIAEPLRSDFQLARLFPRQTLAMVEARLGHLAGAARILDECLSSAAPFQNPLTLGSLHRDRAEVAALAGDLASYAQHADMMRECFEATANPWLIQQCATLRAQAARLGLVEAADTAHAVHEDLDGCTAIEGDEQRGRATTPCRAAR